MDRKEYMKEYREKNKERLRLLRKDWRENNKDKIKEYNESEKGKKTKRISKWKSRGVISNNYDELYDYYINCKNCENCNIELCEGNKNPNRRCLDHDHNTGLFRKVLCNTCNNERWKLITP